MKESLVNESEITTFEIEQKSNKISNLSSSQKSLQDNLINLRKTLQNLLKKNSKLKSEKSHLNVLENSKIIKSFDDISIINKNVGKNDTLICLGDCGDLSYFKSIKADYKVLIKGNHDDGKKSRYYEIFDEVYDGPLFITPKLVLSHEPLPVTPYYLNIHGHNHSDRSHSPYHINLAANIVNYQVFNLGKEIRKGILSPIVNIHRYTIDNTIKNKERKHEGFYNS